MGNNLTRRVQDANPSNGGEVAERPPSIADDIRGMEKQFQLAMPRGLEAAQLIRDALTCLRTTPKLAECERTSVLGGLMTCSQLGLRPGVLGHAWLLPFWDKNLVVVDEQGRQRTGGHRAQLVIGYQGYRELAQRSGQIDTLIGRVVYEHDMFDIDYGVADTLIHKPNLNGSRGKAVGYYAIVKYTSGGYAFWHMSKAEVEEHRDRFAMAKKDGKVVGPWRDNFDEMAVKTVFLRLAKWMPKSTELASAIEADETVRVDLSPNPDALLHGERPNGDFVDGEVVPDEPARGEAPVGEQPPPADTPPAPEPPAGDPPSAEPRPSKAMLTKLHTLLSELDVTDRTDRLATVSTLVQHPLGSTNELTKAEAMSVTDLLERVSQDKDDPGKALDAVLASLDTPDGGEQA
jgi:recombination protein RecT